MKEIEFNLLDEPWIRVRLQDNTVQEVSLTEALVSAQDYVDLAGEMPTQNAAVLRLLLAVLFTVFSRVDAKGKPQPLVQSDDALERWSQLWQLGHFPAGTHPGLSGTVERPLLAVPPDPSLLAGAAGKNRHGVWRGQAQRRNVRKQQ